MKKSYFFKSKQQTIGLFAGLLSLSCATAQTLIKQTYNYTGAPQNFSINACISQVTIEVWGAEGGGFGISGNTFSGYGGKGGYSYGTRNVTAGDVLSIYVGSYGQSSTLGIAPGGYNGGGSGYASSNAEPGNGGGGASDVRLNGQAFGNRIIVAGGGGGGGEDAGDFYGNGGGLTGVGYSAWDATQLVAGPNGSVGLGAPTILGDGGGGGGGYFGGGSPQANSIGTDCQGGGGGSGYIGGVSNGLTIDGTGSVPNPAGGTMTGNSGNGLVVITYFAISPVNLSASNNANLCPGSSVTLTASNVNNYTWTPGGSNFPSIQVSPTVNTTYTVTGLNSLGCLSNTFITVTVNNSPTVIALSSKNLICIGDTAMLSGNGAVTYTWNGSVVSPTFVASPTSSVVSSYTVIGTSAVGCTASAIISPAVNSLVLSTSGNTTICNGKQAQLSASGAAGNYGWTNTSTGISTPFQNTAVSPSVTTIYKAYGTDVNGCVITESVTVTVNPNPTVTASAANNQTVICKGNSANLSAGGAATYSWSTGGTTPTISVTPAINTIYNFSVVGTDANGCSSSANIALRVELCTGIETVQQPAQLISIYPNPGNGMFYFETTGVDENLNIKVYNVSGALIKELNNLQSATEVDLQKEPNGIYFVHLFEGNKPVSVSKLIKQ